LQYDSKDKGKVKGNEVVLVLN